MMLYSLICLVLKVFVWLVIRLLPVEAFNKLCIMLPGRLIIYGLRCYGAAIGSDVQMTAPVIFHNYEQGSKTPFADLAVGTQT